MMMPARYEYIIIYLAANVSLKVQVLQSSIFLSRFTGAPPVLDAKQLLLQKVWFGRT